MKLGIENRKQVIWLAVLGGVALLMLGREFWPSSLDGGALGGTDGFGSGQARRCGAPLPGKMVPVVEPRLDPTLDLKLLAAKRRDQVRGQWQKHFCRGLGGADRNAQGKRHG